MEISRAYKEAIFVSPHLDDAVLSAGGLMQQLRESGVKIVCVTVFTQPGDRHTLSARKFVQLAGYGDASTLYADRRQQDEEVMSRWGWHYLHLGYVDGLWRQHKAGLLRKAAARLIPESGAIYPTYRRHITAGLVEKADASLEAELSAGLRALTATMEKPVVFAPAGFGGHVDHVLVRNVCLAGVPDCILWSDFPYNQTHVWGPKDTQGPIELERRKKLTVKTDWQVKRKMIEGYKNQVEQLFPGLRIPETDEEFFTL